LGVLCDIVGAGSWKKKNRTPDYPKMQEKEMFYVGIEGESWELLPIFIVEEVGLNSNNPYVQTNGDGDTLSGLNDGGHDFNSIANYIEKSL